MYDDNDIESLLGKLGIIRHHNKIGRIINSTKLARVFVYDVGSLVAWLWKFQPGEDEHQKVVDYPTLIINQTTPTSIHIPIN